MGIARTYIEVTALQLKFQGLCVDVDAISHAKTVSLYTVGKAEYVSLSVAT